MGGLKVEELGLQTMDLALEGADLELFDACVGGTGSSRVWCIAGGRLSSTARGRVAGRIVSVLPFTNDTGSLRESPSLGKIRQAGQTTSDIRHMRRR